VSVCLSVCVCVCVIISLELHVQSLPYCLYVLPIAVTYSSSGSVAIHCVLLVLWMTSYLHMYPWIPISDSEKAYTQSDSTGAAGFDSLTSDALGQSLVATCYYKCAV